MDLPEITEVKRLTIRPGDSLVVRLSYSPDDAETDVILARLRAIFGDVPAVVLGPGEDIEVIEQVPALTAAERRKQARIAGVSPASDEYRRIT